MAVIGGGNDFAFDIVGRSSLPEFEVGDVSFVTSKKIPQKSRGFSDGNDEEPRSVGIERAPVADFSRTALDGELFVQLLQCAKRR